MSDFRREMDYDYSERGMYYKQVYRWHLCLQLYAQDVVALFVCLSTFKYVVYIYIYNYVGPMKRERSWGQGGDGPNTKRPPVEMPSTLRVLLRSIVS